MKSLAMLSAVALLLAGTSAGAQDAVDPAEAARQIAGSMQVPKPLGGDVTLVDAHSEGPVLILGAKLPPTVSATQWQNGFLLGLCGNRSLMDRLFGGGMRVRLDPIVDGQRTTGPLMDRCPEAAAGPPASRNEQGR